MSETFTTADLELFHGQNYAWFVTLNPGGDPHASVTWIDATETHVLVNTAAGRKKSRNVERDPRVTVALMEFEDAYVWLTVDGVVEETVTGPPAEAHIDALSRRYDDRPWRSVDGQVRLLYRIRPTRIHRY